MFSNIWGTLSAISRQEWRCLTACILHKIYKKLKSKLCAFLISKKGVPFRQPSARHSLHFNNRIFPTENMYKWLEKKKLIDVSFICSVSIQGHCFCTVLLLSFFLPSTRPLGSQRRPTGIIQSPMISEVCISSCAPWSDLSFVNHILEGSKGSGI